MGLQVSPVVASAGGSAAALVLTSVLVTYDFAVDGGGVGTRTMVGSQTFPDNAVVRSFTIDVLTSFTSGGGLAAFSLELPVDGGLFNSTVVGDLTQGVYTDSTLGGTQVVKCTAARTTTFTIANEAITAGKVIFQLSYWQSS